MILDETRTVTLLHRWAKWAERWWYEPAGSPGVSCFGTGYGTWGVQTNQKYVAAMAVLSRRAELGAADRAWALGRALASLRFSLASHRTGGLACTDGQKWGHTWISALGTERMMHGVAAIADRLTGDDREAVLRVLESECDWLVNDYQRGPHKGIQADKWGHSGKNDPESNIWNGSLLWRTAATYPDHPHAGNWRGQALKFLANGVSVAADADDATVYDGKPLKDRHVGASFFDSYALDHHQYFNVGYMVICVSNAAILHFDMKAAGLPTPQLLHLHQADLWRALRPMVFTDGRLARLGGDSRARYAYCQEYLVPSLLYAADQHGDRGAMELVNGCIGLCEKEAAHNGDGSFYGKRLAPLADRNPYYYVRLEGDRANALSMALAYAPLVQPSKPPAEKEPPPTVLWSDREYGAALHRSPTRLASFAWRAYGLSQGLCLPSDRSDLAEWEQNLAGEIAFVNEPHPGGPLRKLVRHDVTEMPGGFVTSGTIVEGPRVQLAEGWTGENLGTHYIAYVALPDDRTVVGIQVCRAAAFRTLVRRVKGLRLNVPNDLFNGFQRQIETATGATSLTTADRDEAIDLKSNWATIDGRLSVIGLYGAPSLTVDRAAAQRGGSVPSISVDQICFGHRGGVPFFAEPDAVLLDCAWMVATTDAATTARLAAQNATARVATDHGALRAVAVHDATGRRHTVVLNAGEAEVTADVSGRTVTLAAGVAVCWPS